MGQQAGVLDDRLAGSREIVHGGTEPVLVQPLASNRISVLGELAEGEQGLMATGLGPGAGDGQDLVDGQVRGGDLGWGLGEGAVAAAIPAQAGQRDEDLRRVGQPNLMSAHHCPHLLGHGAWLHMASGQQCCTACGDLSHIRDSVCVNSL